MADCNECGFVTTGIGCYEDVKTVTKIGVMKLVADDGTRNSIPLTFTPTQLKALIYNSDPSKALLIIDNLENVSFKPKEIETTTTNNGNIYRNNEFTPFIFTGSIMNVPTKYAQQLNKLVSCGEYGIFPIDDLGAIGYSKSDTSTDLFPRAIQKASWIATQGDNKSGNETPMASFSFQEKNSEGLPTWEVATLTNDALAELVGLESVALEIVSATGTTVVAKGIVQYGASNDPIYFKKTALTNFIPSPSAVTYNDTTKELTLTLAVALTTGQVYSLRILGSGYSSNTDTFTVA